MINKCLALLLALPCSLAFAMEAPYSPEGQIQQAVFHTIGNHEDELIQLQRANADLAQELRQLTARMNGGTQQTPAQRLERAAALAKEKIQRATTDSAQDRRISSLDQRLAAIIAENQRNAADNLRLTGELETQKIITVVAAVGAGVAIAAVGLTLVLCDNAFDKKGAEIRDLAARLDAKINADTKAFSLALGRRLVYHSELGYLVSGHPHFSPMWILRATDKNGAQLSMNQGKLKYFDDKTGEWIETNISNN